MTQQEFNNRRQALLAKMAPASAAVIFSAPETTRSADSDYPYRQNSDFWYLTGFNEPEAVLVLIKSDETHNHSVLFNRVRDLTAEIWFGRRTGKTPRRRSWAWIARCRSMKSMTSCTCCSTAGRGLPRAGRIRVCRSDPVRRVGQAAQGVPPESAGAGHRDRLAAVAARHAPVQIAGRAGCDAPRR